MSLKVYVAKKQRVGRLPKNLNFPIVRQVFSFTKNIRLGCQRRRLVILFQRFVNVSREPQTSPPEIDSMTITRITVMTAMFTLFVSSVATAQSGSRSGSYSSRNVPGTRSTHGTTSGGSTSRRAPSAATSRLVRPPTATLNGYCPVSLAEDTKWVLGKAAFAVTVDGHTYWLASTAHRERFQAEPAKYVPAMHGDCVVCLRRLGCPCARSVRCWNALPGSLLLLS